MATHSGGTVTVAEGPGSPVNYIFPLEPAQYDSGTDISDFQYLMWRPLYWFGVGVQPVLNRSLSIAEPPVYKNHDRTVVITLKPYRWSDGKPVTNRDMAFFINLVKANREQWFAYAPGAFPDDIVSMKLTGTRTMTLGLSHSVNTQWFTHNELDQISPLPQHAWDKTSAHGKVGNFDATAAGARAVYRFLAGQSRHLSTYATNPLWQVVDGPFRLSSFNVSGEATLVPNKKYSGTPKPTIAKLVDEPFTSTSAEYNAVQAGSLTYGYVPLADMHRPLPGYRIVPWRLWAVTFMYANYHNPTVGSILSQLYARQAMQHLIDQSGYIRAAFHGLATATYGPVPLWPKNNLASSYERQNPYPFSVSAAKRLLSAHGWKVVPGGTDTCLRPGTGPAGCGAGVAAGAAMRFRLLYPSGDPTMAAQMEFMKSDFAQAGITLTIQSAPSILNDFQTCTPKQAACSWQIVDDGSISWFYGNDSYPTGDQLFQTGAASDVESYSNPEMNSLIRATETQPGTRSLHEYENFTAKELPVFWMPVGLVQLSAIKDSLHGATPQSPVDVITPETWSLSR